MVTRLDLVPDPNEWKWVDRNRILVIEEERFMAWVWQRPDGKWAARFGDLFLGDGHQGQDDAIAACENVACAIREYY